MTTVTGASLPSVSTKAGNLLGGFAVAVLLSAPFVVPSIAGIATWKIIMGMAGLWIFVRAGMSR